MRGEYYNIIAEQKQTTSVNGIFDRGNIFFTSKNGSLISAASLRNEYTLSINPSVIKNPENIYTKISSVLNIDKVAFLQKARKVTDPYEEIMKNVPEKEALLISDMKILGVFVEIDKARFYPGKKLASNVIGFVGYNGNNLEGRYGLEKYYDDLLLRSNTKVYANPYAEIFLNFKKNFLDSKEGDIVTSIEPEVQGFLESKIAEVNKKWSSQITGGIILDPKTGEIYAMAVTPTFDPNEYGKETNISLFGDPLVSNAYEMGSIIKAITMASGIDSEAVTAETTYNDKGFLNVDGYKVSNYDGVGRGVVNMQVVLNNSLNTGASFVESQMGKEKFVEYFKKFGFGMETGIDLPAEASGNIENLKSKTTVEYYNASFGQGISMTPIITARALAVLANGGKLITPHVVKRINYKWAPSKNISYINEADRVIKKTSSDEITRMLVEVVDNALLNGSIRMEHYSIAAKTGTAQIARPGNEGGGYYPNKYLHSFFGYFPAYNPRFLVLLYTFDPKGVNYASQTLTMPFADIAKYLINYYEIAPDR
ncbi:MAG: penicillin-binding protein 2 [Minisyncoccia bacterium]